MPLVPANQPCRGGKEHENRNKDYRKNKKEFVKENPSQETPKPTEPKPENPGDK